ncbi:MAG: signal peptidase II [Alphaproteobacteria bacterium]|nr:signal peptidase II [Alphaproteobacteria bacterium]
MSKTKKSKKMEKVKISGGLLVALGVLLLDQISKVFIVWWLGSAPGNIVRVTGFFNLRLAYNRGISFSMMTSDHHLAQVLILVMVAVIVGGLVYWLRRESNPHTRVALWMIIGGAIGNVIDRVRIGAVIDFLDFHLYDRHWPTFNVADSAIFIGAAIIVYWSMKEHARKK